MAETTGLLNRRTGYPRTAGSNPALSDLPALPNWRRGFRLALPQTLRCRRTPRFRLVSSVMTHRLPGTPHCHLGRLIPEAVGLHDHLHFAVCRPRSASQTGGRTRRWYEFSMVASPDRRGVPLQSIERPSAKTPENLEGSRFEPARQRARDTSDPRARRLALPNSPARLGSRLESPVHRNRSTPPANCAHPRNDIVLRLQHCPVFAYHVR